MIDWKKTLISPDTPIIKAIQIIDESALQIALVVNSNNTLIGLITDGDIRRGILKGFSLEEPVHKVMFAKPITAKRNESRENILSTMKLKRLHHIPIVDDNGCVIGLEILDKLLQPHHHENWVILMAGGPGSRLRPLTDDCPKPLLKVGEKPLLESILENYIGSGFRRFYISVHYKAEMIKEYIGDGSRWNVEIRYLQEVHRMGTAGALGLLPEKPNQSLIIMNSDLLTKVNFNHLLDFHLDHYAQATMCVREYDLQVPYGVVKIEKNHLVGIEEKPVHNFFISAGIYVIEPNVIDIVPKDIFFDMPSLFKKLIELKCKTIAFPIREYWLDIGCPNDFERANGEYGKEFK